MESVLSFVSHKVHFTFKSHPELLEPGHTDTLTLIKNILGNIIKNAFDEKIRKIKLSNSKFSDRVVNVPGAFELLVHSGFRTDGEFAYLPMEVDMKVIDLVITIIEGYEQEKYTIKKDELTTSNSIENTLKLSELVNAAEKLKSDSNNPEYRLAYATAVDEMKQEELYSRSITLLSEAIENIVNSGARDDKLMYKLYYRIASLQYTKQDLDSSLESIKLCQELMNKSTSEDFSQSDFGELHHLCACIYGTKKMIKEAVEEFEKALQYNYEKRENTQRQKCNTIASYYLKQCMEGNEEFDNCVNRLMEVLNESPGHEHTLLVLGMIHQSFGKPMQAAKFYKELLLRPDQDYDGILQAKNYGKQKLEQLCLEHNIEIDFN